ncbi:Origin recognition complex subunit 3 [Orobanche gracilis]
MAPAADPSSSQPIPSTESNLQPFFILHKASPRKSATKTRRRIDLSPKTSDGSTDISADNLRLETFQSHWFKTESIIKDVLRDLNADVFEEIYKWVRRSFDAIRVGRTMDFCSARRPYPILNSASNVAGVTSRQIFTALLFTKNMEFVDDILTFEDLGVHLRSNGCYVANLTSSDFSAKNGVGGSLKTLLRQFLMVTIDAPDMSILASWYSEQDEKPLVIIIEDVERCCGSVLNDFIVMLREWVIKVPMVLVLGVATTVDALRNILSSNTYLDLSVCEFNLGTPAEKMDAVVEAVFVLNCESFSIGRQVSAFLRNYFLRHDGTLTLFIRALKIAMVQHIYTEPLSFNLRKLVDEKGAKGFEGDNILLRGTVCRRVLDLPSLERCYQPGADKADLFSSLSELRRLRKLWSSTVMCLFEVGKYHKITLLDLYCEILEPLEPEPRNSGASDYMQLAKDSSILWAIHKVRDFPTVELRKLLSRWEVLTRGINEIHEKVKELQSLTTFEEARPKREPTEPSKRPTARNHINEKTNEITVNEKVATFLQCIVRLYIQPIESLPLNGITFFDDVDKLQTVTLFHKTPFELLQTTYDALIGDPRRRIQTDLLESNKSLMCSCCINNGGVPVPSTHDTSIMYSLAQEHGDLINLHEWFHSFKAIISQPTSQAKKRSRMSPAEFCRAVTELQITGLIRMPSKRRPDYVQRVAFGL